MTSPVYTWLDEMALFGEKEMRAFREAWPETRAGRFHAAFRAKRALLVEAVRAADRPCISELHREIGELVAGFYGALTPATAEIMRSLEPLAIAAEIGMVAPAGDEFQSRNPRDEREHVDRMRLRLSALYGAVAATEIELEAKSRAEKSAESLWDMLPRVEREWQERA